jgi:hypothetical protein
VYEVPISASNHSLVLIKSDVVMPLENTSISSRAVAIYVKMFLADDPEIPGSIPGATRFSE